MNELISNFTYGKVLVRTVLIESEPWFVGVDIALALGYSNPRDALVKHVDLEDKGVAKYDTPGGLQEMTVINEPGVYSLTFSSQLESAKKFKRWVTHEVLPSIRKQGFYSMLTDDKLIEVLTERTKQNPKYLDCIDKTKIKKEATQAVRDEKLEATREVWFKRFTHHEEVDVPKELRRIWAGDMPMYHKYLDKFHVDERKDAKGDIVTI